MQTLFTQLKSFFIYFIKTANNLFFSIIFLIALTPVHSQNHKFYIPDSLKNKSYKDLNLNIDVFNSNPVLAKIYANAYLSKAKNEKDTIKIANGYSQLASLAGKKSNYKATLNYCDSIITLTKNSMGFVYPSYGYMVKGIINYSLGNYKTSLKNYLLAQKIAAKNNNIQQLYYIQSGIGELKMLWGNYNEAKSIAKKKIKLLYNNKDKFENYKFLHFSNILSLTNTYCLTKQPDSAKLYIDKEIKESIANKDSLFFYPLIGQLGIIQYYQGNYKKAIKNLDIEFPYLETENGIFNNYYYKALSYKNLLKDSLAFSNFKKADSIYNITKDVTPEIRDIEYHILNYYKQQKDVKNQLKYLNRLLYADSIIDYNKKYISETILKKYDRPALLLEKDKIIKTFNKNKENSYLLISGLSILVIVLSALIINYYKKQKKYKNQFKKLTLKLKETNTITTIEKKPNNAQGIPVEIINQILNGLKEFEQNNEFINNKINLNGLAKKLNTNSNYLSKIINFYKEKNFSSYLSDLRIDYCIKKLTSEPTFRKYAIKAIASEIGFNNTESFSKAFYTKTGIYPSYFIKKFDKQERNML
jgi:AraC-like DNA-binding protein